ncbi:hypothetical protein Clacol_002833 [Clathrus columnatus]|uniref:MI domain-containing protein n=1 Tax=Clathrus columnatus TaxID=1419009 RepID=A0AAV5A5U9_9AGAM|nr:hypothetical protein Clacol_002833 [Clathrus columnatus]
MYSNGSRLSGYPRVRVADVSPSSRQDESDGLKIQAEKNRGKAIRDLEQSWMDRLQLVSVVTTFFAATEAQMLSITTPNNSAHTTVILNTANASLAGALLFHAFAAGFALVRFRLQEAKHEECNADVRSEGKFPLSQNPLVMLQCVGFSQTQSLVPILSGTLSTNALITSAANTLHTFVERRMRRLFPLGKPFAGSQISLALTGCLVVWAAALLSRKPKSREMDNYKSLRRFVVLVIPVTLGVISSGLPPIASPTLPYVRHSVSPQTGTTASVRVLAQKESTTGLILTGEYIEKSFRFLRADHSLLGGRWIGSKVTPDSRNNQGDSIYSTFVLQEAVRLIEPKDGQKGIGGRERALFIGLGAGIAAEAFLAHKIHTTIIEIDPAVYNYARWYFGLPEPNAVFLEDAQRWIESQPALSEDEKYDYIIHDCFSGGGVPGHIYTIEFWNELKRAMKKGGVIVVNFAGKLGSDSAKAIYLTLEASYRYCRGYHDHLHAELDEEQAFLNIVKFALFFCSNAPWRFRDANVDDYLGSHLRKHMLRGLAQRELPRTKILGRHIEGEYQWILHANDSDKLVKWEEKTALDHWKVMREVLPDIFWETMSKPLTATVPKISPSQPPTTSAWAQGRPNINSSSSTPRSQSPSATTQPSTNNPILSHSRKPSTLGGPSTLNSTFRDGVSVPKSLQPSQKPGDDPSQFLCSFTNYTSNLFFCDDLSAAPTLAFGTIAEPSAPISSNPVAPLSKSSDSPSVITFGTVSPESVSKTSISKSNTPVVSSSPSPTPIGSSAKSKKLDVKALFRTASVAPSSVPSPTSSTGTDNSPAQRHSSLPQAQNSTSSSAPHNYVQRSNGPPSTAISAASPRGSQYNRPVGNGTGPRNAPPTSSSLGPSSPSMSQAPVQHQPHVQQHPLPPHSVPPPSHPHPQSGSWHQPYYVGSLLLTLLIYFNMFVCIQFYDPSYWMPPTIPPAPSPSHISSPRPPVPVVQTGPTPPGPPPISTTASSPYPSQQPPYPYPYSPAPPNSTPQTPTARLSSAAPPFVPSMANKAVQIRNPNSGQPVDLSTVATSRTSMEPPSSPSQASGHRRKPTESVKVRIESEESHNKRLEEERLNKEKQEKTEQELAAKRQREFEEKRKRREEEEERKRKEEERKRKEEEERQAREEKERLEKEQLERERLEREQLEKERQEREQLEKERLRLERLERERKEQEERERFRKEEEERQRLQKEEEEKERERLRVAEEERLRKEASQKAQQAEEEERAARCKEESDKKKEQNLGYSGSPAPSLAMAPPILRSSSPQVTESLKSKRPVPEPLDLSATSKPGLPSSLPSALATARAIDNLDKIQYPEGIASPKPELNTGASNGKFRYDREFLLQFMSVCLEKPDSLPALDAIGLEPVTSESGVSSNRMRGGSRNMPPPSIGSLKGNLSSLSGSFGTKGNINSQALMGQFTTASGKINPDDRISGSQMGRSASMGGPPGSTAFPRSTALMRTASQGGAVPAQGSSLGPSGRTRSQRGRNRQHDTTKPGAAAVPERERTASIASNALVPSFESIEPLRASENRWMPVNTRRGPAELDPTEVVERKVKSLLNKLTMEKFDSISAQIIEWANRSENEKDGRTLIQVIRLVFEKATDEAAWSEMYARLCRKMMEQVSSNVQDETIRTTEGKPITGGQLFRKYLLNRCQEDFEQGWSMKEAAAKAAESKAADDKAAKDAAEEAKASGKAIGEEVLYSDEYYAAQKAKRRGLGLVKFIGELFKLQMLTERIMHECIKKLLGNVENPEEEEIESLCKLFTTIGRQLDTEKSSARIDVYIKRMEELSKSSHINYAETVQDVLELRERRWVTRNAQIAPTTIAAVHEQAAKDQAKAQQEQSARMTGRDSMSRGGSRRGENRSSLYPTQPNADGWTPVVQPRPTSTAGDLTKFGKIDKTGTTTLGPASVFSRKDVKGRDASTSNMFAMLTSDAVGEPLAPGKSSRPPSRKPSADFTRTGLPEPASQRKQLALLPRSLPRPGEEPKLLEEEVAQSEPSGDEVDSPLDSKKAKTKIGEDLKEFWALKNFDEADSYISKCSHSYRSLFIDQLIASTLERKELEASIAGELLTRWATNGLCPPSVMEKGFEAQLEFIDDIAIDVPAAYRLVAILLKGSKLLRPTVEELAGKIFVEGVPVNPPKDKLLKEYDSLDS